jgi:hypothetical protein
MSRSDTKASSIAAVVFDPADETVRVIWSEDNVPESTGSSKKRYTLLP